MSDLPQQALSGDQRALARALTLLERGDPAAGPILRQLDSLTGSGYTVGVTGPPGAGKSTLVDQLTGLARQQGLKVGVIAADPSSPFTGGALLGDRIRMQRRYQDPGVFIRSVATRGEAGGLPRVVKGMARLLDAAGYDLTLVETVGVGQTELGVMGVADTVLVALVPEAGDAIQTLKAGVMEIGDIYLVNKADRPGANQLAAAITATLNLTPTASRWTPPVLLTRAQRGEGMTLVWETIQAHRQFLAESGELAARRRRRRQQEFLETIAEELNRRLRRMLERDPDLQAVAQAVADKTAEPYSAALELLNSNALPRKWLQSIPSELA